MDGLRFRPRLELEWSLLCSPISSKALARTLDSERLLRSSCLVRAMEIERVRRRRSESSAERREGSMDLDRNVGPDFVEEVDALTRSLDCDRT